MLGIATSKNLEEQEMSIDYKFDVMYDYIDQVEESLEDKIEEEIGFLTQTQKMDREAVVASVMSLAFALKVTPEKLANALYTLNLPEYTGKVNAEIERLQAQKLKSVKKK